MTNNSGSASCYCDHICYVIGDCCSDVADIGCYLNTTGTWIYNVYTSILTNCPLSIYQYPVQLFILHIPVSYSIVLSPYTSILTNCPFSIYQYLYQLSILHIPVSYSIVHSPYTSILFNCPFSIYQYPYQLSILHIPVSLSIVHSPYTSILTNCPFSIRHCLDNYTTNNSILVHAYGE